MAGLKDIAKEVGLDPLKVEGHPNIHTLELLERMFSLIVEKCADGDTVRIKDFGTFSVRLHKGRKLETPLMEGGAVKFGDILLLKFKQSGASKRNINTKEWIEKRGGTYVERAQRPSDIRRAEETARKKAEQAERAERAEAKKNKDENTSADTKSPNKMSSKKDEDAKKDVKKNVKKAPPKKDEDVKENVKKNVKKDSKKVPPKKAEGSKKDVKKKSTKKN